MILLSAITLTTPAMVMGVGLVVLPIVAHLMNRRASRRVVFPSVQLLASVVAAQSSVFRLRRWWLLLLRCLAVVAIAIAFARPVWMGAQGETPGGEGAAVVIVVDRSASVGQRYTGVSGMHWVRSDARRVLDALVAGEDVANIVYATARPYGLLPGMTSNIEVLRGGLGALEPTYERADMGGALALAGRMLAGEPGRRRVVILTDLQASNWGDALERLSQEGGIAAGTGVTVIAPEHASPGNLGLHGGAVLSGSTRVGQSARLTVMLTNYGEQPKTTLVRMRVDGLARGSKSVSVGANETRGVSFEMVLDGAGEYLVEFSLPGDVLAADDRCYLVVLAVERPTVVVVSDDDTNLPGTGGYFMVRALSPYGDVRDRYRVRPVGSAGVTWPMLDGAAAVFVGDTGVIPGVGVAALHRYMEMGGGMVFFLGDGQVVTSLEALNRLSEDGVLPWMPEVWGDLTAGGEAVVISGGDWGGPLLSRLDETGGEALAQVRVMRRWSGGALDERGHVLLGYWDGVPALVWRGVGAGRLVLANMSPEATHSDLGKHGVFVSLMQGLVEDLQGSQAPKPGNVVGEVTRFTTDALIERDGAGLVVVHPDGETLVEAAFSIGEYGVSVGIHAPDAPGFYTVMQGDTALAVIAVNIDPRESDLRRVSADEIRLALRGEGGQPGVEHSTGGAGLAIHGEALWGWWLLIGLGLLGLEMGLVGYWRR